MIISPFFCLSPFVLFFTREQKDRVLISNITQMEIQEFIIKHKIVESINKTIMTKLVLKDNLISNCKFDFYRTFTKSAFAFYVLKTYSFV